MTGVAYGTQRSLARGQGAETAGSRPYRPGDRLAWIDWSASARLSLAKDEDLFVVRQYYAELAPRVVIVVDRGPSMQLYPPELPWLRKSDVLREALTAIVAAAHRVRALVGYLDYSDRAHWIAPHRQSVRRIIDRLDDEFDGRPSSLGLAVEHLLELRRDVPAGSFVFVVSDFLQPPPAQLWSRARARRWDLVPVIVQDPVWEQSFPPVKSLLLPIADPTSGRMRAVRMSERDAIARRSSNEARLAALFDGFRGLDFDPVLLDSSDPAAIDAAFMQWAVRRRQVRGRAA
jgi:uncharacterized protein (DUF58 family)